MIASIPQCYYWTSNRNWVIWDVFTNNILFGLLIVVSYYVISTVCNTHILRWILRVMSVIDLWQSLNRYMSILTPLINWTWENPNFLWRSCDIRYFLRRLEIQHYLSCNFTFRGIETLTPPPFFTHAFSKQGQSQFESVLCGDIYMVSAMRQGK